MLRKVTSLQVILPIQRSETIKSSQIYEMSILLKWSLGYLEIAILESILFDNNFQAQALANQKPCLKILVN